MKKGEIFEKPGVGPRDQHNKRNPGSDLVTNTTNCYL